MELARTRWQTFSLSRAKKKTSTSNPPREEAAEVAEVPSEAAVAPEAADPLAKVTTELAVASKT